MVKREYIVEPADGKPPEFAVIFFHGCGSSADLMRGHVGGLLAPLIPEARLYFPDAPIEMGFNNHSWFEVRDMIDAPDHKIFAARAREATPDIGEYIDKVLKDSGLPPERVIIAGFSQGGTMAYYAAMLHSPQLGGVFALSGGALAELGKHAATPPVALLAGELEWQDYSGVPQQQKTHALLAAAGIPVETTILPKQGHDISLNAMQELARFARAQAAPKPAPKPILRRPGPT